MFRLVHGMMPTLHANSTAFAHVVSSCQQLSYLLFLLRSSQLYQIAACLKTMHLRHTQEIVKKDVARFFTLISFIFLGFCAGFYAIFKPLCFEDGMCTLDYKTSDAEGNTLPRSNVFPAATWPKQHPGAWVKTWSGAPGWPALANSIRFLMFTMIGQGDVKDMQEETYAGAQILLY